MSDETPEDELEVGSESDLEISEFERLVHEVEDNPGCASFPRLAEAYRRDGQIARARQVAEAGLALAPERLGGRVALALAQLDLGEVTAAIQGLASILESVPPMPTHAAPEETSFEHRLYAPRPAQPLAQPLALPRAQQPLALPLARPLALPLAQPLALPSPLLPQVDLDRDGDNSAVDLREEEIDEAFDHARAEADQMLSANDVAEAAMLDAEDPNEPYSPVEHPVFATETMASLLEGQGDIAAAAAIRSSIPVMPGSYNEMFAYSSGARAATQTEPESWPEAELDAGTDLEGNVDTDDDVIQYIDDARAERRARIVNRLEGWLANIRRDVA